MCRSLKALIFLTLFQQKDMVSVKPFNMMMEEQEVSAFHGALVKALVVLTLFQ